jgi:hypothetical protein
MGTHTVANLTAVLSMNNTKFKRGVSGAKSSLDPFRKSIMALGPAIAGAFTVGKLVSFTKESMRLYDIQAKAERSLLVALKGREDAQQRLIAQAKALQKETLFGDEETIKAQALIAAFVEEEEQIKKVIPLVQDMATAKKMELSAAADLVSKTLGSSTNALSRYGVQVEGAVGSTKRLDSLTRGLSNAFAGQAKAAAETGMGIQTQLTNVINDLKEQIGQIIVEGANLVVVLGNIKTTLEGWDLVKLSKDFREFKEENAQWLEIIKWGYNPLMSYNKEFAKLIDYVRAGISSDTFWMIIGDKKTREGIKATRQELERLSGIDLDAEADDYNKMMDDGIIRTESARKATEDWGSALREVFGGEGDLDITDSLINLGDVQEGIIERYRKWKIATREQADATELLDGKMSNLNLTMEAGFTDEMSASLAKYKDAMKQLEQQVTSLAAAVAGDLAFAFGEAMGGMDGLGDKLAELGIMIMSSLGDILIAAGIAAGIATPAGLGLILSGLTLKLGAGIASGIKSNNEQFIRPQAANMGGQQGSSMLYGNDIRTSYNYSTNFNNRVG